MHTELLRFSGKMAGCIPCFIIPLLLFIFHRYLQPFILKFWNPWGKVEDSSVKNEKMPSFLSCPCSNKNECTKDVPNNECDSQNNENTTDACKLKSS